jgi:hypothetical protein
MRVSGPAVAAAGCPARRTSTAIARYARLQQFVGSVAVPRRSHIGLPQQKTAGRHNAPHAAHRTSAARSSVEASRNVSPTQPRGDRNAAGGYETARAPFPMDGLPAVPRTDARNRRIARPLRDRQQPQAMRRCARLPQCGNRSQHKRISRQSGVRRTSLRARVRPRPDVDQPRALRQLLENRAPTASSGRSASTLPEFSHFRRGSGPPRSPTTAESCPARRSRTVRSASPPHRSFRATRCGIRRRLP